MTAPPRDIKGADRTTTIRGGTSTLGMVETHVRRVQTATQASPVTAAALAPQAQANGVTVAQK